MAKEIVKYNAYWNTSDPLAIEMACIRKGGNWTGTRGQPCGSGLAHHYKAMMKLIWPGDDWCRWDEDMLRELVDATFLGIAGPSSSRKTSRISRYGLCVYWCFPHCTTVLCSTTTREKLDLGIWGEIKKCFRKGKERYSALPGVFIESKQQITTDGKDVEGREFRNGIKGVACKKGGQWEGLANYLGIKNDRVLLLADEAQLMEPGFFDSSANLSSNSIGGVFQLIATGNPNDTLNSFGRLCEPMNGWDTFQQGEKTQVWNTKFRGGRCLRLVGTDSPNFDRKDGLVVHPRLIDRRYINEIASTYGVESWQYLMWVLAKFPISQLERRVITRQMCVRFRAFEPVTWGAGKVTKILTLDAAYGAVGGDRCVAQEWAFGGDVTGKAILALVKSMLVPVSFDRKDELGRPDLPEYQIARWVMNYCLENDIKPERVAFDSTGRGSLMSAFAKLGTDQWRGQNVVAVEFGGRATDRESFANPKKLCKEMYGKFVTELWFAMRALVETEQIRGLTDEIVNEFQMRAWDTRSKPGSGTTVQDVEPKEDTKERLGRSPDLADCAVVAGELARRLGFRVHRLGRQGIRSENALLKLKAEWDATLKSRELRAA